MKTSNQIELKYNYIAVTIIFVYGLIYLILFQALYTFVISCVFSLVIFLGPQYREYSNKHLFILSTLYLFFVSYFLGGISSPVLFWVCIVPMAGIYLDVGKKFPIIFVSISITIYFIINTFFPVRSEVYHTELTSFLATIGSSVSSYIITNIFAVTIKQKNSHIIEINTKLSDKNQSMAKILENIHQGIFMIDESLLIDPEYSNFLEDILEQREIAGIDIKSAFLSKANLSANDLNQVESALTCCLGEAEFIFRLNEDHLPNELLFQCYGSEKYLELSWEPIITKGKIEKVMVSIRDVTVIRKLQEQAAANKATTKKLVEIIECGIGNFRNNIGVIEEHLQNSLGILTSLNGKVGSLDQVNEIFRNLHTIKGNARSLQLREIVETAHEVEQFFDKLRKRPEGQWNWNESLLRGELIKLNDIISNYHKLYSDRFGSGLGDDNENETLQDSAENLVKIMDKGKNSETDYKEAYDTVHKKLLRLTHKGLAQILRQHMKSLERDAKKLGKEVPTIDWGDMPIWVPKEKSYILNDVFGHLLRNSIDHGLEKPDDRKVKGKPTTGQLRFEVVYSNHQLSLRFGDDGKGLNLAELREKHPKGSQASDKELGELIFKSGLSTSKQVSDISGRGVGLDAVRSFLVKEGGDIWLEFIQEEDADGSRQFQFVLSLPFKIPDFLKFTHTHTT